ncbi:TetR/AcrR family transcriptional regulator [Serratia inhibens]|nr:TetR/AcrR family transcriptional regulator [Serratia inhibens]
MTILPLHAICLWLMVVEGLVIAIQNTRKNRGRPRTFDLELALGKAILFFKKTPFKDCSLDALMLHMGLTTGSFYKAFSSKNKIFQDVFEVFINEINNEVNVILFGCDGKKDKIKKYLYFLMSFDGVYGNQLLRTAILISNDDVTVSKYIDQLSNILQDGFNLIFDVSCNKYERESCDYKTKIVSNYLLGVYILNKEQKYSFELDKELDELILKFLEGCN